MKRTAICLLALTFAATLSHAQGKISLRITTEKQQKTGAELKQLGTTDQRDVKSNTVYVKPTVRETNQSVTYLIKIQNMGPAVGGLVVKYAIFGRDRASQQIETAVQSQETVDIKSLQTQSLKTKSAQFSATVSQYGYGLADKKQGSDCYGIGVAVYSGKTRVATFFSPPGLEQQSRKLDASL